MTRAQDAINFSAILITRVESRHLPACVRPVAFRDAPDVDDSGHIDELQEGLFLTEGRVLFDRHLQARLPTRTSATANME